MRLSRAELAAVLAHASTDETRPHVCCLHVVPGKLIEATDGHRLARLSVNDAEDGEAFLVPRAAADKALRACSRKGLVEVVKGGLAVYPETDPDGAPRGNATRVEFRPVEAAFPPTDQVLPKLDEDSIGGYVHLDGRYLADAALVALATERRDKDAKGKIAQAVSSLEVFPPMTPLDPVLIRCEDPARARRWLVVIMPRRPAVERTEADRRKAMKAILDEHAPKKRAS